LVGRHAEGGVALQELDRAEALARGERHILARDVVLKIDERLRLGLTDTPERQHRGELVGHTRFGMIDRLEAGCLGRLCASRCAFAQRIRKGERAGSGTDDGHPTRHVARDKAAMASDQRGRPPR